MPETPKVLCERCEKPEALCVCAAIRPLETRHQVLILQHPQEPDKELGSARLAHLALPGSTLKIGLSWKNLKHALGREADPRRWAVLYLGSGVRGASSDPLVLVDRGGKSLPDSRALIEGLEGIIVLDGTWSQAKTLWWRNAWLLKCRRAILNPREKSLYGELRREPRRECLSTLESVAAALAALGEPESTSKELRELFGQLLDRKRAKDREKRAQRLR
jgi:DTW domain-containing protein YfiP